MAGVSVEQDGYVRRAFERIRLAPGSVGQEGYVRRTSERIHLGPSSAGLTAQTTDRDARYNIPLPLFGPRPQCAIAMRETTHRIYGRPHLRKNNQT